MSITQLGIQGERLARKFLQSYDIDLFQADWFGKKDNRWILYEIKYKEERFSPPPYYGHGLDIYQVEKREQFRKDTDIRTFLLIFEQERYKILGQWLDVLEEGEYFDTTNNIRVYCIDNYVEIDYNEELLHEWHNYVKGDL